MKFFTTILLLLLISVVASAQWTQTGGPGGGPVSAFAANDTYLFASSGAVNGYGSGVYRSSDSGATWTNLPYPVVTRDDRNISALAVAGSNIAAGASKGVVYLSSDNGTTWIRTTNFLTTKNVTALVTDGVNLYAGTNGDGVFSAALGSQTWTRANTGLTSRNVSSLLIDGADIYATIAFGGGLALFKTSDQGANWTQIQTPAAGFNGFAIARFNGNLYFNAQNGVYVSTDNGATWPASVIPGLTSSVSDLRVVGTTLRAASYSGLYTLAANGSSWTRIAGAYGASKLFGTPARLFAGLTAQNGSTNLGIFLTTNGGTTWTDRNAGFAATTVQGLLADGLTVYAVTRERGLFSSSDDGTTWTLLNADVTGYDALSHTIAIHNGKLYAPAASGLLTSTDGGTTWASVNTGFTLQALYSYGSRLVAGEQGGVRISTDNGASWNTSSTGLPGFANINCFGTHGAKLFAGLYSGGAYVSTDSGATWTESNTGLSSSRVRDFLSVGADLYAATDGQGVFKSTDDGATWTQKNTGVGSSTTWALAASGSMLFIASNNGVAVSLNGGELWRPTIPWPVITNALVVTGTHAFAGTLSNGVWHAGVTDPLLDVNDDAAGVPTEFSLGQNYPNPFNPVTHLRFTIADLSRSSQGAERDFASLSNSQWVTLKVYNVLGKEVAILVNEMKEPGSYTVSWNASGMPSGVYFYRLTAGAQTEVKRMVLTK